MEISLYYQNDLHKKSHVGSLQKIHKVNPTEPVIDMRTRYNSTFAMLEWSIWNKEPLTDLMKDVNLVFKHWNSLGVLFDYLKVFDRVTSYVASQNSIYMSLALLSMERLIKKHTRDSLEKAIKKLLKYREKYHEKIFLIATLKFFIV